MMISKRLSRTPKKRTQKKRKFENMENKEPPLKVQKTSVKEENSENKPMEVEQASEMQNVKDAEIWMKKKEKILQEVKSLLEGQIRNTSRFESSFLSTSDFTDMDKDDTMTLFFYFSQSIEVLVERCIPRKRELPGEAEYNKYYPIAYEKVKSALMEFVQKHYLTPDEISKPVEKARKKKTADEFKSWWASYLTKDEDDFMKTAVKNALNWFAGWLYMYDETWIKENMKQLDKSLKAHFDKESYIAKSLFEDIKKLLVPCISKEISLVEPHAKLIRYAFDEVPFIDNYGSIEQLSTYVDACMIHYEQFHSNVIAPYFAICQSSGYGKSRVISELGKTRPLLYVSLQKHWSSGYPSRTTNLANLCFGDVDSINESALRTALRKCLDYYQRNNRSPMHYESNEVYGDLSKSSQFENAAKVAEGFKRSEYVVLVIDEARELLEPLPTKKNKFRQMHDLLASLWGTCHVFAILVDTQSRIANFSPPVEKDPSGKMQTDVKKLLYHPYILTWTFDAMKEIMLESKSSWKKKLDAELLKETNWENLASLRRMGRPMWKWSTYEYGRLKLYGTSRTPPEPSFEACLAIVFSRIGCMMSPASNMTSDLVANHMATLLDTAVTHGSQLAGYISDPFLAYCATSIWVKKNYLKQFLIPAVRTALVRGAVETGYLGELVARVIILCILDKKRNINDQDWAKVRDFVNVFNQDNDLRFIPENAKMGVFHFVQYTDKIAEQDLAWLVKRRAGAMLQRNHRGADILLPYWYKGQQDQIEYRYILVQVKNTINDCNLAKVFDKLKLTNVFKNHAPLRDKKYEECTPRIVLNLKSDTKAQSHDDVIADVRSECIKYYFQGSKLDLYKDYLHGCEDQLLALMQDSYGVKKWQDAENDFASTFKNSAEVKALPLVNENLEPPSYFRKVPEQMVFEQLPYNRRMTPKHKNEGKSGADTIG